MRLIQILILAQVPDSWIHSLPFLFNNIKIWVKAGIFIAIFFALLIMVNHFVDEGNEILDGADEIFGDFGMEEDIVEEGEEFILTTILAAFAETISSFMWLVGILCFLPVITAITATIRYMNTELAVTSKRAIGKVGVISSHSMDTPLDKINNVSASSGLFGKIFHYGKVSISDGGNETIVFDFVEEPDQFKRMLMQQIEEYQEAKIREQAERTASAMAGVMNQQAQQ